MCCIVTRLKIIVVVSASLGAFAYATVFGWVTPILDYLESSDSEIPMTTEEASWMISFPEFTNLITPIPAGILADRYGRKPVILLSAPLFIIGWVIILCFKTYVALLVARLFHGAGVGVVFAVIPVYIGEIASTESRGAVSSLFFIFSWLGYSFEYCTGPFLSFTNYTIATLATAVLFFLMFLFQPETPYFYLMKGNRQSALKSLKWFRSASEDAVSQELETMIQSVEEDKLKKASWREVVATPTDRKALFMLLFVGSLRVLSGTMPILSYATENFNSSGGLDLPSKYITILLGGVLVLGSCCSFFILDYFGRRPLLILSSLASSISLLVAGIFYFLQSETSIDVSSYSLVAPIAIIIYAGVVTAGLYPVNTAYTSELFNSKTRSTASSITAVVTTLFIFITLKCYQNFIDIFGVYFNFLCFGIICLIGAIVSYFCMPETKGKTFEEIRKSLVS